MFGDCLMKMLLTLTGIVTTAARASVIQSEFLRLLHYDMNSSHIQEINYLGMTIPQCLRKCHGDGQCLSLLHNQTNGCCKILYGYLSLSESKGPRDNVYFVTGKRALCIMAGFSYSIKHDICYLLPDIQKMHRNQISYCQQHHSSLLRVDSMLKQNFLQEVAPGILLEIDGMLLLEGDNATWRFSDGTDVTTNFWASGYPDGNLKRGCIVASVGSRLWLNTGCGGVRSFICEKEF